MTATSSSGSGARVADPFGERKATRVSGKTIVQESKIARMRRGRRRRSSSSSSSRSRRHIRCLVLPSNVLRIILVSLLISFSFHLLGQWNGLRPSDRPSDRPTSPNRPRLKRRGDDTEPNGNKNVNFFIISPPPGPVLHPVNSPSVRSLVYSLGSLCRPVEPASQPGAETPGIAAVKQATEWRIENLSDDDDDDDDHHYGKSSRALFPHVCPAE